MILLLCVAFPPIDLGEDVQMNLSGNSFFDPLIGLALIALAGLLLTRGVRDLGNSLTPFPKPRGDNVLKTKGAYAATRHPMYSGLVFGSFGLALATGSPVRTFFAAVLTFLLNEKAATEELFLEEMHGKEARPTHRSLHDRVGAVNADPY
ncbi:uncharacterized protein MICPUCDRAFT_56745 [Micromonas pusilla CCMP1545]|jgi:protein-S-isoprenylcysteine O-methyltransferase Ste14|uniref:Predicted protein n=1 Tax=Micromonas pusilla (strain CCMP1545) TaxID=564608 RepID=C1MN18_MICPC|nr:uncharacterized protein MICPUCDRAFT_56745 [Micromonas pusilla CCMP1545]EEH58671.1 predicted protein [Micromonas pusilla CCMP1545]|eukprot:XP_003057026.1 predicted protein [Micromonas pusilla CCMP1545]